MTNRLPALLTMALVASASAIAQADGHALLTPHPAVPRAAVDWNDAELARSPMIRDSRFVRVDAQALLAVPSVGAVPLATFALDLGVRSVAFAVTHTERVLGYRLLDGEVPGRVGEVHFVVAPDGTVWGSIDVGREQFVVASTGVGDVHVLQQIDQGRLPLALRCGVTAAHNVLTPPVGLLGGSTNSDCSQTIVDIMVFYTPRARMNAGGTASMEATIIGAIAQANAANEQSSAPFRLRLVHCAETNYVETGAGNDLGRFRNQTDGYMDEVHQLRQDYGGDLMHLITDPVTPQWCGIAYLMGSLSNGFASSAFAATIRTCIPGRTFTHECGHNMGSHHDPANAGSAIYPYSYGYRTPDNAFRTIMSYAPGQRVNRWSSPNVQYQGYTMGVAGSQDNVQSLTDTCTTVAQFRATRSPVWCDLGGGIAGTNGVPTMTGSGTVTVPSSLELTIRDYAPNAVGVLIAGGAAVNAPLFGGTLVPSPDITLGIFGAGSEVVEPATWLSVVPPGTQVWLQSAFLDPAAVQSVSASGAVRVTAP